MQEKENNRNSIGSYMNAIMPQNVAAAAAAVRFGCVRMHVRVCGNIFCILKPMKIAMIFAAGSICMGEF